MKKPKDVRGPYQLDGVLHYPGDFVFWMKATVGVPVETLEMWAEDQGSVLDLEEYRELLGEHVALSKTRGI